MHPDATPERNRLVTRLLVLGTIVGALLALSAWLLLGARHVAAAPEVRSHAAWVGLAFAVLSANVIYSTVVLVPGYARQQGDGRGAAAGITLATTIAIAIPVALYHSWRARSDPIVWTYWGGAIVLLLLGAWLTQLLAHSAWGRYLPVLPLGYALGAILLAIATVAR